jgi:biotin-dependent carboxylase-like uncharacterized protein
VTAIEITRAGPLATIQDEGRFGALMHGVAASGPMDRAAFRRAGAWLGGGGSAGIEFTTAGLAFRVAEGSLSVAMDGGEFSLSIAGMGKGWPFRALLREGETVEIAPGPAGNYGYLRFDREIDLAPVMGSRATNIVAHLGGFEGRALRAGDVLRFGDKLPLAASPHPRFTRTTDGPIRVVWGLHADLFEGNVRERFASEGFAVSPRLDRMGVRLEDRREVFADVARLALVSDAIVPGDIQILGDGTPIVLLRDHQPTGGYPRIASVISADLDRFAQLRPGAEVRFQPVTMQRAQALLRDGT